MEKNKKDRFIEAIKEDILSNTRYQETWYVGHVVYNVAVFDCYLTNLDIRYGSVGSYFLTTPECFIEMCSDRYGLSHHLSEKLFREWYDDIVVDMYDSKNRKNRS